MSTETVLLTGASGYIALEIAYQILSAGKYKLKGTVRSTSNESKLAPIRSLVSDPKYPIELVEADLTSDKGWDEALKDVDYVLHTASPFVATAVKNEDDLIVPAREGTLRVLKAASKPGSKVKRVIVTSSCAAIAYGHGSAHSNEKLYTEQDWSTLKTDAYTKSKTLAEQAAWQFVETNNADPDSHKFELATINPSLVVGPYRGTSGASLSFVSDFITGKIPIVPRIGIGYVAVTDVAAAHISAIAAPEAAGHRHIMSADSMWLAEMCAVLRPEFEPLGYDKIPSFEGVPYFVVKLMSFFMADMKTVALNWGQIPRFDHSRAEKVLGIKFSDVKQALIESGHCLIKNGDIEATPQYKEKYMSEAAAQK